MGLGLTFLGVAIAALAAMGSSLFRVFAQQRNQEVGLRLTFLGVAIAALAAMGSVLFRVRAQKRKQEELERKQRLERQSANRPSPK